MKSISIKYKIRFLLLFVGYRFLLRFLDYFQFGNGLNSYDWLYLFSFIILIFTIQFKWYRFIRKEGIYTSLYLLYGTLLGEQIALALTLPKALILSDWIWVALGIFGVILFHFPEPQIKESTS